jgi:hypothetical protein
MRQVFVRFGNLHLALDFSGAIARQALSENWPDNGRPDRKKFRSDDEAN